MTSTKLFLDALGKPFHDAAGLFVSNVGKVTGLSKVIPSLRLLDLKDMVLANRWDDIARLMHENGKSESEMRKALAEIESEVQFTRQELARYRAIVQDHFHQPQSPYSQPLPRNDWAPHHQPPPYFAQQPPFAYPPPPPQNSHPPPPHQHQHPTPQQSSAQQPHQPSLAHHSPPPQNPHPPQYPHPAAYERSAGVPSYSFIPPPPTAEFPTPAPSRAPSHSQQQDNRTDHRAQLHSANEFYFSGEWPVDRQLHAGKISPAANTPNPQTSTGQSQTAYAHWPRWSQQTLPNESLQHMSSNRLHNQSRVLQKELEKIRTEISERKLSQRQGLPYNQQPFQPRKRKQQQGQPQQGQQHNAPGDSFSAQTHQTHDHNATYQEFLQSQRR
jgi:hypothetical protein